MNQPSNVGKSYQGVENQMSDLQAKIKKLQDTRDELQKKIQQANQYYQESLAKLK